MKRKARKNIDCCIVEVEFPETSQDGLDPLIDFLAELLAEERIRELEAAKSSDTTGVQGD